MIGTLIAASVAVFLVAVAALELLDGAVDQRRLAMIKLAQPRIAAPAAPTPVAQTWEAPEKLLKAA